MTERATSTADVDEPSWWKSCAGMLYILIGFIAVLGLWVVPTDDAGIVGSVMWFYVMPLTGAAWIVATAFLAHGRNIERSRQQPLSARVPVAAIIALALLLALVLVGWLHFF